MRSVFVRRWLIEKKMVDKKYYLVLASVLVCVIIVSALWIWGPAITGYSVYKISSSKPNLTISTMLIGGDFNVTDSGKNFTDLLVVDSTVNEKAIITFQTIKTGTDESCTDYLEDCNITYYSGEGYDFGYGLGNLEQLFNGDEIQLIKGENKFSVIGTCKQYSCPQTINATIVLSLKTKA
jgi:hypothetical protein